MTAVCGDCGNDSGIEFEQAPRECPACGFDGRTRADERYWRARQREREREQWARVQRERSALRT